MKLSRHVAADIIGLWTLLQECSLCVFLERMVKPDGLGGGEGAGMMQLQLRAQPLCRVAIPGASVRLCCLSKR